MEDFQKKKNDFQLCDIIITLKVLDILGLICKSKEFLGYNYMLVDILLIILYFLVSFAIKFKQKFRIVLILFINVIIEMVYIYNIGIITIFGIVVTKKGKIISDNRIKLFEISLSMYLLLKYSILWKKEKKSMIIKS